MGYECYRKQKGNRIWHMVVAMVLCFAVLMIGGMKTDENVTDPLSFVLTGVFIIAYGLCFILHRLGTKQIRVMMKGLAFGLALGEIILNIAVTGFYSLNRTA